MAEYYVMKFFAGFVAGGSTLCVLLFILMFFTFTNKIVHYCDIEKAFKWIFTISGIVALVVPFFVESAEYHIIHNGRNYFTNEIIYLKDGGIHFQNIFLYDGACVTIDNDYIIKKI